LAHSSTSSQPLRGLLASQLQCKKCAHKCPVRYDTFDSLSLSIPAANINQLSVARLLNHYIRPETVDEVECEGCTTRASVANCEGDINHVVKSTFLKKLTIGKAPQCLCIHIQRTVWLDDGMPMKRHDHVSFPEVLNIEAYMERRRSKRPTTLPLMPRHDIQAGLVGGRLIKHQNGYNTVNSRKLLSSPSPRLTAPYSTPVNLLKALNYHSRTRMSGLVLMPLSPRPGRSPNHNGPTQRDPPIQRLAQKYSSETSGVITAGAGPVYKLVSVIVHLGDVTSGHFVTYRRAPCTDGQRFPDRWLYTSDTLVKKTSLAEVLSADAYMLFYEKV